MATTPAPLMANRFPATVAGPEVTEYTTPNPELALAPSVIGAAP
jgi:hypothetical protein